ncbi:MAG: O-antigen ligase family protein [Chitinophagales bacterium]|nr:O-antigen ligase family protein [Chitinophagales bacterium]
MKISTNNIVIFLLYLFCAALPLSKAIGNITELSLLVFSFYQLFTKERKWERSPIMLVSTTFIILLFSLLNSTQLNEGIKNLIGFSPLLIIPIIISIQKEIVSRHFNTLSYTFIGATLFSFSVTLLYTYGSDDITSKLSSYDKIFLPHPNHRIDFYGMICAFVDRIQLSNQLGISTLLALFLAIFRKKYFCVILAVLCIIASILLGGRGGQIALVGGLLIFSMFTIATLLQKKLHLKFFGILSGFIISLLIIGGSTYIAFKNIPALQDRYEQHFYEINEFKKRAIPPEEMQYLTSIRRYVSWINNWKVIQANFWMGTGIGDFDTELKKAYASGKYQLTINHHSQYLYIWGVGGLIGFSVFILSLLIAVIYMYKLKKWFIIGVSFLSFYLITFIPDAVLLKQTDCMTFAFFFSVFLLSEIKYASHNTYIDS